jgi:hypothetical protein
MTEQIKVTLKGGKEAFYPAGITVKETLAEPDGEKLHSAVAAKVDGVTVDRPRVSRSCGTAWPMSWPRRFRTLSPRFR